MSRCLHARPLSTQGTGRRSVLMKNNPRSPHGRGECVPTLTQHTCGKDMGLAHARMDFVRMAAADQYEALPVAAE